MRRDVHARYYWTQGTRAPYIETEGLTPAEEREVRDAARACEQWCSAGHPHPDTTVFARTVRGLVVVECPRCGQVVSLHEVPARGIPGELRAAQD